MENEFELPEYYNTKKPKEEKPKEIIERPPDIFKPAKQIIRQSSEKTTQRLEPIQERTPLYSDLRKERIEKHNIKTSSLFSNAFN